MKRTFLILTVIFTLLILASCNNQTKPSSPVAKGEPGKVDIVEKGEDTKENEQVEEKKLEVEKIDLAKVKPNEAGKVMVVMFHNFVEKFEPSKYDSGEYTTTFDAFERLLNELYEKDYRLINLQDFLNNNIDIPAGKVPMIFTFDDATSGQFNLIRKGGDLSINPKTAVGIMEKFNKTHPDFGLKGTFYVNLGLETFKGEGSVAERLKYLVDGGFEIGNHTYTHVHLNTIKSGDTIQKEIGLNQKKMLEYIPGYNIKSFSLPYGQPTKSLQHFVEKGSYEGVDYQHYAIMEVGAGPTLSTIHKNSTPLSMSRVRSPGMSRVLQDLTWWIENINRNDEFVSDGNPDTYTVPESKKDFISIEKLRGKKLITY